jgi:hypothetical protein
MANPTIPNLKLEVEQYWGEQHKVLREQREVRFHNTQKQVMSLCLQLKKQREV